MDRLLGRCYDQNVTKYLVSYEGYVPSRLPWR